MQNPFFLHGSQSEQGLFQDLINESLKMYGIDVYYLPREYLTEKTIIKDVVESEFNNAYPIEAYVNSFSGYGNKGTLLSKFGIQELDDLELTISRERFDNYIFPLSENIPNIKLASRPKEGDLIYFPLGDRLFEIKYVEHEEPFYQLQKTYVYVLRCELFRYQDEDIDTSIDFIDDNVQDIGYIQTLQMIGVGTTATAITNLVYGGVRFVTMTNRGSGYSDFPTVSFSESPEGSEATAVGVASMISNNIGACIPDGTNTWKVQAVQMINSGYGYTVAPAVAFFGGGGKDAAAFSTIGDGIVGIITVTSGGSGYFTSPNVSFVGVGTSAQAYAVVSAAGTISEIRITNAGLGYTEAPTIVIDPPPSLVGVGTYVFNEILVGSISSATARVNSWNSTSNILEISRVSGEFVAGEQLIGQTSGASYSLRILNTDNLDDEDGGNDNDGIWNDNKEIEDESQGFVDNTESNPLVGDVNDGDLFNIF
jgi:hypothetical protein